MKIAHLSDLHVTEGQALEDQREDLTRIVGQVLEARPDLVVLTGDYYGRTVPHRPSPRERGVLEPLLVRLAEAAPVLVLEGNHDHGEALALAKELGGAYPIQVLDCAGTTLVPTPAGPARVYWLAYPTKRWLLAGLERPPGVTEATSVATARVHGLLTAWRGRMERQRQAEPGTPILFLGHFQVGGSMLSSGEVLQTGEIEIARHQLEALPVHYGALGHVHKRQEIAPAWWYVGNPWPVDFGETGIRGWHLITVGDGPTQVVFHPSGSRPWITLRYRWAADREDGGARWISRPSPEEIEAAKGAVVRARLVVPDVHAATCPWEAEVLALEAIAHRVQPERTLEPTVRVRAPAVAEAATIPDKIRAWWGTLASPPEAQDQAAALEALAELEVHEDEAIASITAELVARARGRQPAA